MGPRISRAFTGMIAILSIGLTGLPANAWDRVGHITVTRVAFDALPDEMPAWIRTREVRSRLEYLSNEPDRWRGQHDAWLDHFNGPDHYFDIENLDAYGLTLQTMPRLRGEFNDALATARARDPQKFEPRKKDDTDYTALTPGQLPFAIAELHAKIASSWTTLKTYEENRDYVTDDMIADARANVVHYMGLISHFVGDGSQPLHTTQHHHGWVGDNPKHYSTEYKFHSYIDGDIIDLHKITPESMTRSPSSPRKIERDKLWETVCAYLSETHDLVEPLYELEKSGELRQTKGKQFIETRLQSGGEMLAGVWLSAYRSAKIDDYRVRQLKADGKVKDRTTAK